MSTTHTTPHKAYFVLGILRSETLKIIILIIALLTLSTSVWAAELAASWYSIKSLKDEGTYKYSKGVCADGSKFSDNNFTCASWDYPFGSRLMVYNVRNGKSVVVVVTDRTARRFKGIRIDLSPVAFARLDKLSKGIIKVEVKKLN